MLLSVLLGVGSVVWGKYTDIKVREYTLLASESQENNNLAQATEYYKAVLSYDKNNYVALMELRSIYLQLNELSKAKTVSQAYINAYPQEATGYINLAKVYEITGDTAKALETASISLDLMQNQSPEMIGLELWVYPYVYVADLLVKNDQADKAKDYYSNAIKLLDSKKDMLKDKAFYTSVVSKSASL